MRIQITRLSDLEHYFLYGNNNSLFFGNGRLQARRSGARKGVKV